MLFPRIVSFGALVCVCLSVSPIDSSHVLVVAPSGGQFATIQAAVDAAENGDSILVKGGTYPGTGGTCTTTLASNNSCSIVVVFAPTMALTSGSMVKVSYNDGFGSTLEVHRSLTGKGQ